MNPKLVGTNVLDNHALSNVFQQTVFAYDRAYVHTSWHLKECYSQFGVDELDLPATVLTSTSPSNLWDKHDHWLAPDLSTRNPKWLPAL